MANKQADSKRRKAPVDESFGDAPLVNVELMPVPVEQRILGWQHLGPLWGVLALVPGVYAFVGTKAPTGAGLAGLAIGLALAALAGLFLARTAARYGIGFAAICRAAFGARGALLPMILRWVVGAAFVAFAALALGGWLASLAVVALPKLVLQYGALRWVTWGCAWLLILGAWWIARGGMSRVALFALLGSGVGVCLAFGLVVFAGIASKGFGDRIGGATSLGPVELAGAIAGALLLLLPGVISAADWARFRRPRKGKSADRVAGSRWLDRITPLVVVPVGVGLAFVGLLLASASAVVRGSADAAAIPDAAGFGGLGAGAAAAGLSMGLWLAAIPLVGFYSPALALAGTWPRRIGYRRGLTVILLLAAGAVPALDRWGSESVSLLSVSLTLAPVLGVLLVDELLLRRGRVIIDDLFHYTPSYGPTFGTTVSALIGCGLGWLLHPELLASLQQLGPPALADVVRPLARVPATLLALGGGALVAGLSYGLLSPVERRVIGWLGKRLRRRRHPELLGDNSTTHGLTNPNFTYDDKDRRR